MMDLDDVFKALADGGRRRLLDALRAEDGQTLAALCTVLPAMTRFGVMKHLARARGGRARRHPPPGPHQAALPQPGTDPRDPRPLDHQVRRTDHSPRWSACAAPSSRAPRPESPEGACRGQAAAHATRLHQGSGRAGVAGAGRTPSSRTEYFHGPALRVVARAAARRTACVGPSGAESVEGTIEEFDPPRRLVVTWRVLYDAAMARSRRAGSSGR